MKKKKKTSYASILKWKKLSIIFLSLLILSIIGLFAFHEYKFKKEREYDLNELPASPASYVTTVPSKTVQNSDIENKSIVILDKGVCIRREGILDESKPCVSIIIEFSKDIIISDNRKTGFWGQNVTTKTATYTLYDELPGGGCPMDDDKRTGCTYDDEKLDKLFGEEAILRLWRDSKRGIFQLNFQMLAINGYTDWTTSIYKEKPSETFTNQDILFWKEWLKKAKTIELQI